MKLLLDTHIWLWYLLGDRTFFGSAFAIAMRSIIAQRAVGNRSPSNHHIVMVKMDKIVSRKRGWKKH